MSSLTALFDSLARRLRPEDVAHRILSLLDDTLTSHERALLTKAASGSLASQVFGYSSMVADFARPTSATMLVARGEQLFDVSLGLDDDAYHDPEAVELAVRRLGVDIRKRFGQSNFLADRLTRAERVAAGVERSRRKYNRCFRHLVRMERKILKMTEQARVYRFTRVGKSGLATELSFDLFATTPDTAAFTAYFVARKQLRSEFTIFGQQRAFDEIAAMLLARCERDARTSWLAIAHVMPNVDVLVRLGDGQKGELLGRWDALLADSATYLGDLASRSAIDFETMVVKRGNDSTRWNQTAGAYNESRAHYIALLYALGAEEVLDVRCPGKVCKLIAGDVAAWHQSAGHGPNAEVAVQATLPFAWDVLAGRATCTREDVERACRKHGIVAEDKGFTAPRRRGAPVRFRPTPELVHGVEVASPMLASVLRASGFFSGKHVNHQVPDANTLHAHVISAHVRKKGLDL